MNDSINQSVRRSKKSDELSDPSNDTKARLRPWASQPPMSAPASATSRLSAMSWRMRRRREAPIASRTAISRSRALARASIRLARLPQAMSSTSPAIVRSSVSGVAYWVRTSDTPPEAGDALSVNLR